KETLHTASEARRRRWFDWQGLRYALHSPPVRTLILTFFLTTFAFGGLESTLSLMNKSLLKPGEESAELVLTRVAAHVIEGQNFLVFAYVGFILMLTQGLIYRRFVERVGEVRFMRVGIALMTFGLSGAVLVCVWANSAYGMERSKVLTAALFIMTLAVIG